MLGDCGGTGGSGSWGSLLSFSRRSGSPLRFLSLGRAARGPVLAAPLRHLGWTHRHPQPQLPARTHVCVHAPLVPDLLFRPVSRDGGLGGGRAAGSALAR